MGFAAIAFAAVFFVVLGIYWGLVVRPENSARGALRRRLRDGSRATPRRSGTVLAQARRLSDIDALNRVLQGTAGVSRPVQKLIDLAGVKITVGTFVLATLTSATLTFVLLRWADVDVPLALLVSVLAATLPYFALRHLARRRLQRFEELFPEALDLVGRALRAGHAFSTGLAMVAEEVADPVGPEFRLVYDQQNFGMPLPDALRGMADRIPLLDVQFFVTAVLTQREAGGNLAEVLDNLTSVIRDRFKVRRQVRAVTAHARITGWVLVGLPPVTALLLLLIAPEHLKVLVEDPVGIRMVVFAVVLQVLGSLVIRRLVQIEY